MSVHYKFKSSKDFDTVKFDGPHVSIGELKRTIIQQKKIGKSADYDLQIINAQTKEIYASNDILVPKNTSVLVSRIPIVGSNKKQWHRETLEADAFLDAQVAASSADVHVEEETLKVADISASSAPEEDKIKAMISQSSQEFDSSRFVKKPYFGPPPASYICHRCLKPGHWIVKCPLPLDDKTAPRVEVKRSTGIPRSFMVPVDDPNHKGVKLSANGVLVIPTLDAMAYQEKKVERPPFVPDLEEKPVVVEKVCVPEDLQCLMCKELLSDAVLIPCCGTCFCDECIRSALLDSDHHECPVCHELDQTPDKLIPNRFLRNRVSRLKNGLQKNKEEIQNGNGSDIKKENSPVISDQEKPAEVTDQPKNANSEEERKPLLGKAPENFDPSAILDNRSRSPEERTKDENCVLDRGEKIEAVKTEWDTNEGRIPSLWRAEESRGESGNFKSERRKRDVSPSSFRRYPEFSHYIRGHHRDYLGDVRPYQPLNPPPMPFNPYSLPPPGYQPPPPGLGTAMLSGYSVGYHPMGMMPVPMGINPNNKAEREALEEFERKLSEMRRLRKSPSPHRRRRYTRDRSRSYSPRSRGNARRRSRSSSRDRIRSRPRRRSKSRSPYGRKSYRSSSREGKKRFRDASPQEYTKPIQINSRKYRGRSQDMQGLETASSASEISISRALSPLKPFEPSSAEKKKKKKRKTKSGGEDSFDKKKKKKKHKRIKDVQEADTTQPEKEDREDSVPVVVKIEDAIEDGKTSEGSELHYESINSPEYQKNGTSRTESKERTPILDQESIATVDSLSEKPFTFEHSVSSDRESTPVPGFVLDSRNGKPKLALEVIQRATISSKEPRNHSPLSNGVSSKVISLSNLQSRLGHQLSSEDDVFKFKQIEHHTRDKSDHSTHVSHHSHKRHFARERTPSPSSHKTRNRREDDRKEHSSHGRKSDSRSKKESREIYREDRQRDTRADRSDRRSSPTSEKSRKSRDEGRARGDESGRGEGRTVSRRSRSRDRDRRGRTRSRERRERDKVREQEELLRKERQRRKELERELEKQKRRAMEPKSVRA